MTLKYEWLIRKDLQRIRCQIAHGDDSEVVSWVISGILACSQRPLRDHSVYGGHDPLPPEAKPLVIDWVQRIKGHGVKSIICLLEHAQLKKYYAQDGFELHQEGLLGYYRKHGFSVVHIPMTD